MPVLRDGTFKGVIIDAGSALEDGLMWFPWVSYHKNDLVRKVE